jgi:hypothetical protein
MKKRLKPSSQHCYQASKILAIHKLSFRNEHTGTQVYSSEEGKEFHQDAKEKHYHKNNMNKL